MRFMDFSSWQGVLTTVLGLAVFTLIGVGIRVLMMLTIQQRQQRMNRQINERLRTLIAAYKVLGGSFTGTLTVNPTHMRDLRQRMRDEGADALVPATTMSERNRRMRDAVEAALSDIILLGTEDQVRLAAQAAADMAAGKPIETAGLVASLRDYIRTALDLGPVPADVTIPVQGPSRQQGAGSGRGGGGERGSGGGGGAGAEGGGGAAGGGMGIGLASGRHDGDGGAA
jgi:uncharacterized membrane protein YgcG